MDIRTIRLTVSAKHPAHCIYTLLQGQGVSLYVYISTYVTKAFSISFNNTSTYGCTISVLYIIKVLLHGSVISWPLRNKHIRIVTCSWQWNSGYRTTGRWGCFYDDFEVKNYPLVFTISQPIISAGKHTRLRSCHSRALVLKRFLRADSCLVLYHGLAIPKPAAFQFSALAAATTGIFKFLCS